MIINSTYILEILVLAKNGKGISGIDVNYKIKRSLDNSIFSSGILDDNGDGIYSKGVVLSELGQFRVLYETPNKFTDTIETILVTKPIAHNVWNELLESHCDENSFGLAIQQILGLNQKNFRLFDIEYDLNNQISSTIVKVYKNSADLENNINPMLQLFMQSQYNNDGRLIGYKSKEI